MRGLFCSDLNILSNLTSSKPPVPFIHLVTTNSFSPSFGSITSFSSFSTTASGGPFSRSLNSLWSASSDPWAWPSTYDF